MSLVPGQISGAALQAPLLMRALHVAYRARRANLALELARQLQRNDDVARLGCTEAIRARARREIARLTPAGEGERF